MNKHQKLINSIAKEHKMFWDNSHLATNFSYYELRKEARKSLKYWVGKRRIK